MKIFFHLLKRELADRRYFFAAALAIGFSPYLLAPVAIASADELDEVRIAIARVVLASFLIGVPLVLGARWLVADFAGGRRAFELARPLSAFTLSSSKLAAIGATILVGAFLAGLPATVAAGLPVFGTFRWSHPDLPLIWLAFLPALAGLGVWSVFTLAQMLSFLLVDRGRIAVADFGALLLFAGLLGYVYRRCETFGAFGIATSWLPWLGIAFGVLGFFGAWRSFQAGSLLERAHRRHCLAISLGLLALGTAAAAATAWVVRPDVEKLTRFTMAAPNADATRWLVAGQQHSRGFEPLFAVDPGQKQATYLAPRWRIDSYPFLSADGRRIGFFRDGGRTVRIYELDKDGTQGLLDTELWEKSSHFLGVDDRLESMVTLDTQGELRAISLEFPGRELAHVKHQELQGQLVPILHRAGSLFDLVVLRHDGQQDELKRIWTATQFTFDAKSGELRRGGSWSYLPGCQAGDLGGQIWWREALPLLEAGVGFAELTQHRWLLALEEGRGVRSATLPPGKDPAVRIRTREWVFFDAENARLGSFKTLATLLPAGEIRPGLLLVGRLPAVVETYPRRREVGLWHTLVVEVPSGRILRVLQGFAPARHFQVGGKVWLVDRSGAPYDLESAEAEPRPILPWHPLSESR